MFPTTSSRVQARAMGTAHRTGTGRSSQPNATADPTSHTP
jgi:hypothetical protein